MRKQKKSFPEIISASSPDYTMQAADVIRGGGIVAFPTETYYGLGVDPFNEKALKRLFTLKQRIPSKAILVIVDRLSQLDQLVSFQPEPFKKLIKNYWPGPLSLIFPARPGLSDVLTGGSGTIGVRISSNRIATAICSAARIPITATSANISGESPARSAAEVIDYFSEGVDLVVDGGISVAMKGSTIATAVDNNIKILREGQITISH